MAVTRGFVERLEVGRAGLVTVELLLDSGARQSFTIADLDADPERFNERLSKLGLLRDAQNRAEPVEIEGDDAQSGEIGSVTRVTRDSLAAPQPTTVSVMIVGVAVMAKNATGQYAEASDTAQVFTLSDDGSSRVYVLDMQIPERAVAAAQLAMIRDAQTSGATVSLYVDAKTGWITGVQLGGGAGSSGGGVPGTVDGFVEAIEHAPMIDGKSGVALVSFTTAPAPDASGVVPLDPFTPVTRLFLVVVGSPEYELFLTGLGDKLRMRVAFLTPQTRTGTTSDANASAAAQPAGGVAAKDGPEADLVCGAKLLHALATASRPVWIQISRKSLDVGPDKICTDGLPSNDLAPRSLRDLHIPYKAEWIGWGCFNHGVYRFQFALGNRFEIQVDGKPLCVHASKDGMTQFAHACLDGEHQVRVELPCWTCDQEFAMDVYRIR
jgi:hypothetical protein